MLLENSSISEGCVLLIDEMYLQKSVQYHSGYLVWAEKKKEFCTSFFCFHNNFTKILYSMCCKILSEDSISWQWLSEQTDRNYFSKTCGQNS